MALRLERVEPQLVGKGGVVRQVVEQGRDLTSMSDAGHFEDTTFDNDAQIIQRMGVTDAGARGSESPRVVGNLTNGV